MGIKLIKKTLAFPFVFDTVDLSKGNPMLIKEAIIKYNTRKDPSLKLEPMDSPQKVLSFLRSIYTNNNREDVETLYAIALDTKLKPIAFFTVSTGTLNECTAHPRDIFRFLVGVNAYGFIMSHNHPSGDPSPSRADLDFTLRIKEAARMMQIHFFDHIIIGSEAQPYYSFKEANYI